MMTEQQYLTELEHHLQKLKEQERADIMRDFREYFQSGYAEGKTAAQIIDGLGSVKVIADELLQAYSEEDFVQTVKLQKEQNTLPYNRVYIEANDADITVLPTDREEAYVDSSESTMINMSIVENELRIQLKSKDIYRRVLFFVFNSRQKISVTIYLPKAHYEAIVVKNDNGFVELLNQHANKIDVFSDNGNLQLVNILAAQLKAYADNGKVVLKQVIASTVEAETDNGRIEVYHSEAKSWTLNTDNGRIVLHYVVGEVEAYTDNGRIEVTVEKVIAPLTFETDNGAIKLATVGELENVTISAQTDLGSISIYGTSKPLHRSGTGQIPVRLETDLGSIKVEAI